MRKARSSFGFGIGMAFAVALASAALGCGATASSVNQKVTRGPLTTEATDQFKATVAEGDALWAERLDEQKLRGALAKWEEAIKVRSDDPEVYVRLARGNYFLADAFLAFDENKEDEFLATHEKGQAWAAVGLKALSPQFEAKLAGDTEFGDAIEVLGKEAVPLLYWYDVNLGKWAKFKGITTTLKYKDTIFKIMTRVSKLDDQYFHGAADRYWGAYYAVAPSFAGGDIEKSRTHFDASVKKAPTYLGTHVLIAELYATKAQDRALFDKELKFVLDSPVDTLPDLIPEQQIEKKKAERLLKNADELF
jgi:hypothetical protein